jgi:hypothetical protein
LSARDGQPGEEWCQVSDRIGTSNSTSQDAYQCDADLDGGQKSAWIFQ